MRQPVSRTRRGRAYRTLCAGLAFVFLSSTCFYSTPGFAQGLEMLHLPVPGTLVPLSDPFVPVLLKGMTLDPQDPFSFDFIVDNGQTKFSKDEVRAESEKLVRYFLASLTVPTGDFWVNLSPSEKDHIIPKELSKTELGRDMLAQDYLLKQLTASLVYPEKELGKKFWDRVHKQARKKFGTATLPVNAFNKVWVLPESALVYENGRTVYVVNSRLKVMTDGDYAAVQQTIDNRPQTVDQRQGKDEKDKQRTTRYEERDTELASQLIRELIIPAIEREVNEGRHFAPLRQIYHSLILAKWYKETVKNSLLSEVYVDRNKVAGVDDVDEQLKEEIYARYMTAYKKGVYNYIKQERDEISQKPIARKYFSGGIKDKAILVQKTYSALQVRDSVEGELYHVAMRARRAGGPDRAVLSEQLAVSRERQEAETAVASSYLALPPDSRSQETQRQREQRTTKDEMRTAGEAAEGDKAMLTDPARRKEFLSGVKAGRNTFAMLKPDALAQGQSEEILARLKDLERLYEWLAAKRNKPAVAQYFKDQTAIDSALQQIKGKTLTIQVGPTIHINADQVREFYKIHTGRPFLEDFLVPYMVSGPAIPLFITVNEGEAFEVVSAVRNIIRAKYQVGKVENLMHASDKREAGYYEANTMFGFLDEAKDTAMLSQATAKQIENYRRITARMVRDFHVHSTYSDGLYTPQELAYYAALEGVTQITLADHDNISGLPAMRDAAREHGLDFIPGVELTTKYNGRTLHLLGYGFDIDKALKNKPLMDHLNAMRDSDMKWMGLIAERSRREPMRITAPDGKIHEVSLTEEDLKEIKGTAPAMFNASLILQKKLAAISPELDIPARHIFFTFFRRVEPDRKTETYAEHIKEQYLPLLAKFKIDMPDEGFWRVERFQSSIIPIERGIELIKGIGGIPVIAHPGEQKLSAEELADLAGAGAKGMEVYSFKHTPEELEKYRQIAEANGLFVTSGTDYHGPFERILMQLGRAKDDTVLYRGMTIGEFKALGATVYENSPDLTNADLSDPIVREDLLKAMRYAGMKAGRRAMELRRDKALDPQIKDDKTLKTKADIESQREIVEIITQAFPGIPIRSEEKKDMPEIDEMNKKATHKDWLLIIDSLDGTSEFSKGLDEFAVSIAIAYKGQTMLAVVAVPALSKVYSAHKGRGAFVFDTETGRTRPIRASATPLQEATLLVSASEVRKEPYRSRIMEYLIKMGFADQDGNPDWSRVKAIGSTTLKSVMIADSEVAGDVYLTFSYDAETYGKARFTKEWDIAAADLIAEEAGASMSDERGEKYSYGKPSPLNLYGLVVANTLENHAAMLKNIREVRELSRKADPAMLVVLPPEIRAQSDGLFRFLEASNHFQNILSRIRVFTTDVSGTLKDGDPEHLKRSIAALTKLLQAGMPVRIVSDGGFEGIFNNIISKIEDVKLRRNIEVFCGGGIMMYRFDQDGQPVDVTKTRSEHKDLFISPQDYAVMEDNFTLLGETRLFKNDAKDVGTAQFGIGPFASQEHQDRFLKEFKALLPVGLLRKIEILDDGNGVDEFALKVKRKGINKAVAFSDLLKVFQPHEILYTGDQNYKGGADAVVANTLVEMFAVDLDPSRIIDGVYAFAGFTGVLATAQIMEALARNMARRKVSAADRTMLSDTQKEALDYQQEVRGRFQSFEVQAREHFSDPRTALADIKEKSQGYSYFHHVQVSRNMKIREVFYETQKIIRDVLGTDLDIVHMDLDEIHVTISNDDVDDNEKLVLSLDQLLNEIEQDVEGVGPFDIELVGPRLMKNGAIIMEFTTKAPEFLHLRKKAEKRILERRERGDSSPQNRAFAPNIFHSTVSVIHDKKAQSEKLLELFERLNQYREILEPITFRAEKITATYLRESDRKFLESRSIELKAGNKKNVIGTKDAGMVSRVPWRMNRRDFLLSSLAAIASTCISCDSGQNNSSRINVSGTDVPRDFLVPGIWPKKYQYVADVDKKIVDRGLSIETLPVLIMTSPTIGWGSASPSYEYRFRVTNVGVKAIVISKTTTVVFSEQGEAKTAGIMTPYGPYAQLKPGETLDISLNHNWDKGAVNQAALLIERGQEDASVAVFVALARLAKRIFERSEKPKDQAMLGRNRVTKSQVRAEKDLSVLGMDFPALKVGILGAVEDQPISVRRGVVDNWDWGLLTTDHTEADQELLNKIKTGRFPLLRGALAVGMIGLLLCCVSCSESVDKGSVEPKETTKIEEKAVELPPATIWAQTAREVKSYDPQFNELIARLVSALNESDEKNILQTLSELARFPEEGKSAVPLLKKIADKYGIGHVEDEVFALMEKNGYETGADRRNRINRRLASDDTSEKLWATEQIQNAPDQNYMGVRYVILDNLKLGGVLRERTLKLIFEKGYFQIFVDDINSGNPSRVKRALDAAVDMGQAAVPILDQELSQAIEKDPAKAAVIVQMLTEMESKGLSMNPGMKERMLSVKESADQKGHSFTSASKVTKKRPSRIYAPGKWPKRHSKVGSVDSIITDRGLSVTTGPVVIVSPGKIGWGGGEFSYEYRFRVSNAAGWPIEINGITIVLFNEQGDVKTAQKETPMGVGAYLRPGDTNNLYITHSWDKGAVRQAAILIERGAEEPSVIAIWGLNYLSSFSKDNAMLGLGSIKPFTRLVGAVASLEDKAPRLANRRQFIQLTAATAAMVCLGCGGGASSNKTEEPTEQPEEPPAQPEEPPAQPEEQPQDPAEPKDVSDDDIRDWISDLTGTVRSYIEASQSFKDIISVGARAVPLLIENLQDPLADTNTRKWSALILGMVGSFDDVFDVLVSVFTETDLSYQWWHKSEALSGLVELFMRQPKELTLQYVAHEQYEVRRAVVISFQRLPMDRDLDDVVFQALETVVWGTDPYDAVKQDAMVALGKMSDARDLETLGDILKDHDDSRVRYLAAEALGEIGDTRAVPDLIYALENDFADVRSFEVRVYAATALGKIAAASGVPALQYAKDNDPDSRVRSAARYAMVSLIGLLGDEREITTLEDILRDDTDYVLRSLAAEALGDIGDTRGVDVLTYALLNDFDEADTWGDVRVAAARALGKIGAASAIPDLEYARDNDPVTFVRRAAKEAIAAIQNPILAGVGEVFGAETIALAALVIPSLAEIWSDLKAAWRQGQDTAMLSRPWTLKEARNVIDRDTAEGIWSEANMNSSLVKATKIIGNRGKTKKDIDRLKQLLGHADREVFQTAEKFLNREQLIDGYIKTILRGWSEVAVQNAKTQIARLDKKTADDLGKFFVVLKAKMEKEGAPTDGWHIRRFELGTQGWELYEKGEEFDIFYQKGISKDVSTAHLEDDYPLISWENCTIIGYHRKWVHETKEEVIVPEKIMIISGQSPLAKKTPDGIDPAMLGLDLPALKVGILGAVEDEGLSVYKVEVVDAAMLGGLSRRQFLVLGAAGLAIAGLGLPLVLSRDENPSLSPEGNNKKAEMHQAAIEQEFPYPTPEEEQQILQQIRGFDLKWGGFFPTNERRVKNIAKKFGRKAVPVVLKFWGTEYERDDYTQDDYLENWLLEILRAIPDERAVDLLKEEVRSSVFPHAAGIALDALLRIPNNGIDTEFLLSLFEEWQRSLDEMPDHFTHDSQRIDLEIRDLYNRLKEWSEETGQFKEEIREGYPRFPLFTLSSAAPGRDIARAESGDSAMLSRPWTVWGARRVLDNADRHLSEDVLRAIQLIKEKGNSDSDRSRLMEMFKHYDQDVRKAAKDTLNKFKTSDIDIVLGYSDALLSDHPDARLEAIAALESIRNSIAITPLMRVMAKDPVILARKKAVEAIISIGGSTAVRLRLVRDKLLREITAIKDKMLSEDELVYSSLPDAFEAQHNGQAWAIKVHPAEYGMVPMKIVREWEETEIVDYAKYEDQREGPLDRYSSAGIEGTGYVQFEDGSVISYYISDYTGNGSYAIPLKRGVVAPERIEIVRDPTDEIRLPASESVAGDTVAEGDKAMLAAFVQQFNVLAKNWPVVKRTIERMHQDFDYETKARRARMDEVLLMIRASEGAWKRMNGAFMMGARRRSAYPSLDEREFVFLEIGKTLDILAKDVDRGLRDKKIPNYVLRDIENVDSEIKGLARLLKKMATLRSSDKGGIDFNAIDVEREGEGVDIPFDPAQLENMENMQIDGLVPIIINITPIPNILPLLGLELGEREEELASMTAGSPALPAGRREGEEEMELSSADI